MNRQLNLLGGVGMGIGIGAGLMYVIDPAQGRRRRSILRDRVIHGATELGHGMIAGSRDLGHRAQGLVAEALAGARADDVDDDILCDRVRSKIGRCVSHPGAILVEVRARRVTLRGPILTDEVDALVHHVRSVRGVHDVENLLSVHDDPGRVPTMQGTGRRPSKNARGNNWMPATRLLAASAGGAMIGYGLTQRFPVACIIGTIGFALLGRAAIIPQVTRPAPKGTPSGTDGRARGSAEPWRPAPSLITQ